MKEAKKEKEKEKEKRRKEKKEKECEREEEKKEKKETKKREKGFPLAKLKKHQLDRYVSLSLWKENRHVLSHP